MSTEKQQNIKELETIASNVLLLKKEGHLRRPLLIEFCGSPKSGKSTIINALNIFLKRNKFSTIVLKERASICPVHKKTNPFFNIWTLCSAVAEIIENLDREFNRADIIIADRGVFDALCWFEWLLNTNIDGELPKLSIDQYEKLKNFCLLDTWTVNLDLIYIFQVDPSTSIKREYANLLTEKRGSIMNEDILSGYNKAIETAQSKYSTHFRSIRNIQTDTNEMDDNPNKVSYVVTLEVLNCMKDLLVEKIGYFSSTPQGLFRTGIFSIDLIKDLSLKFNDRDIVEQTDSIQPIPIVVITNKSRDKVLCVRKNSRRTFKESSESGKLLLYLGGHIRKEDEVEGGLFPTVLRALNREIHEEIDEDIVITDEEAFLLYSDENNRSKKHLAICFVLEMNLDHKRFTLNADEFIQHRGKSNSGEVMTIDAFRAQDAKFELETWSKEILHKVFGIKYKEGLFD